MKIFSLESRWHLVGWSLVLGLIFSLLMYFSVNKDCKIAAGVFAWGVNFIQGTCFGWPMSVHKNPRGGVEDVFYLGQLSTVLINLIFWSIVPLIILSITRHFKYKKF